MTMWRHRFTWTGWAGSPATTTFYGSTGTGTAQALANECFGLLNNIFAPTASATNLPNGLRIAEDPFVDELDEATGDQVGRLAVTSNPDIQGVGVNNWAAPAGACITWSTNNFIAGRRVRGRTFLVPLAAAVYQTDGTLNPTFLSGVAAAITTFINGLSEPVVWHRPTTPGGSDGSKNPIITGLMKDHVAILTSRRD